MMTHRTWSAAAVLVFAVACGGDTAGAAGFCEAARDLAGVEPGDTEQTLAALERMRAEAPDEIADAINTLADATNEAFETQDATIAERPEVLEASAEMDAYLEGNCEAPD